MKTITFYSYKGGSGRTLLLANVAKQMSLVGLNVFAIDLDLEAPGLHHKLHLDAKEDSGRFRAGVVDYLHGAVTQKNPPPLRPCTFEIEKVNLGDGSIWLMPAGDVLTRGYWLKMAELDFNQMFYSDKGRGVPILLELRRSIEEEYNPDFLLIDARTGITELGGVSTTILPDTVVCLLLNNRETQEGSREVLRGIGRASRSRQTPIAIVPIMSRIPLIPQEIEDRILRAAQDMLNEPASELADTLNVSDISVLHSDPEIEVQESLLVGSDRKVEKSPLLRDYLGALTRLIPVDLIAPRISRLIVSATENILDDPDEVERQLQRLTVSVPRPETYTALLKYYRVRNKDPETLLQTAATLWGITRHEGGAYSALIWSTIKRHFPALAALVRHGGRESAPLPFIENAWRDQGANDIEVGLLLAEAYDRSRLTRRGLTVLRELFRTSGAEPRVAVALMDKMGAQDQAREALNVAEQVGPLFTEAPAFQVAWARTVIRIGIADEAQKLLARPEFKAQMVQKEDLDGYGRLLTLAGKGAEFERLLEAEFEATFRQGGTMERFVELGRIFQERGRFEEFKRALTERTPARADEVLRYFAPRSRERYVQFG